MTVEHTSESLWFNAPMINNNLILGLVYSGGGQVHFDVWNEKTSVNTVVSQKISPNVTVNCKC